MLSVLRSSGPPKPTDPNGPLPHQLGRAALGEQAKLP
jgi:hypothetical protein